MMRVTDLPDDIEALKAMVLAAQSRAAQQDGAIIRKEERIVQLEKLVADYKRALFGVRSERACPEQFELALEDIETAQAAMAENETERSRTTHLIYAAEMQVALGNRDAAIQLLEALPRTEDPFINPIEDLVRLVGSQTALRLYREAGGTGPNILLTAASAESDMALATGYLERAFSEFSSKEPWPDFSWMERTVHRAASLGLDEIPPIGASWHLKLKQNI